MRVAFSSMAWNTGSSSPGDELMTLQHFRCRGLLLQRCRNSLSSRVFSMAMTAWAAKFFDQRDLLFGERANLLAIDAERRSARLLEHRNASSVRAPRDSPRRRALLAG